MDKFSLFLFSANNRPFIYALFVADLILRGFSLYRSARKEQKIWFVALLVVNTLGILPLTYLVLNRAKTAKTTKKAKR